MPFTCTRHPPSRHVNMVKHRNAFPPSPPVPELCPARIQLPEGDNGANVRPAAHPRCPGTPPPGTTPDPRVAGVKNRAPALPPPSLGGCAPLTPHPGVLAGNPQHPAPPPGCRPGLLRKRRAQTQGEFPRDAPLRAGDPGGGRGLQLSRPGRGPGPGSGGARGAGRGAGRAGGRAFPACPRPAEPHWRRRRRWRRWRLPEPARIRSPRRDPGGYRSWVGVSGVRSEGSTGDRAAPLGWGPGWGRAGRMGLRARRRAERGRCGRTRIPPGTPRGLPPPWEWASFGETRSPPVLSHGPGNFRSLSVWIFRAGQWELAGCWRWPARTPHPQSGRGVPSIGQRAQRSRPAGLDPLGC